MECGKPVGYLLHRFVEKCGGRHQHLRVSTAQSLPHRFGPEHRKQRTENGRLFQRSQRCDVQFRNPSGKQYRLSSRQVLKYIGELGSAFLQIRISGFQHTFVFADPAQGNGIMQSTVGVALDGFESNIQPLPLPGEPDGLIALGLPVEGFWKMYCNRADSAS